MSEVCPDFQRPSANLHTLRSPWFSMQWGQDVVGSFSRAQPQLKFLLVATYYFTKWVEAVSLSEVPGQQIVKVLWQNIVCRFELPQTIISDNGTNFAIRQVTSFCSKYKIVHRFSTPCYPQGNGQTEISNRTILDNLRKSLDKAKDKLVEKLPVVLHAYRTTKRVPRGETPFSLAYRTEAIILVDICMPTLRMTEINQDQNAIQLSLVLDQSKKKRREAQIRIAAHQ